MSVVVFVCATPAPGGFCLDVDTNFSWHVSCAASPKGATWSIEIKEREREGDRESKKRQRVRVIELAWGERERVICYPRF